MKLPSVRAQAHTMKVSVSTVVEAYERLVAEGIIFSKPGSGFYVAKPTTPLALTMSQPNLEREIDPLWISKQSLDDADTVAMLKPGCGWLPSSWLYEEGIRRSLRMLARVSTNKLVEYSTPLGNFELRQILSRRLLEHQIHTSPEQIIITDSGTHSIDLILRLFLKAGDTVLVDDPCYFNFHALLRAHQIHVVSVPYTKDGPDIEQFEKTVATHQPRLYITNSGIHNPTGAILTPVTAHNILKIADRYHLIIVEDDIFSDFEFTAAPRLATFDGLQRVIQIGSFSKTISASVRCGYIVSHPKWLENIIDLKIATSFGGNRLSSDLILNTLKDSGYRKHMESIRARLAQNMTITLSKLEEIQIKPWLVPQAGMFVWCTLPKGLDATLIAKECLKDHIVLAPGNAFSQSLNAQNFLRFNVSQSSEQKIYDSLKKAITLYQT